MENDILELNALFKMFGVRKTIRQYHTIDALIYSIFDASAHIRLYGSHYIHGGRPEFTTASYGDLVDKVHEIIAKAQLATP